VENLSPAALKLGPFSGPPFGAARIEKFVAALPAIRLISDCTRPQNRGRKTAPIWGPHSHQIQKKNDWENETFERELWHLQGCTLLNQNSLHRKRRRNANAAFAQGNPTPRCLPRAMKEKQRTKHKGKWWEVMKRPVREPLDAKQPNFFMGTGHF